MPRGDGTGPMGMGPMTGRGAGYCAGFPVPGYANPARGFGYGFGRGYRRGFYATGLPGWARYDYPGYAQETEADERALLSNQVQYLEEQLREIKKRLSILDEESE